MDLGLKGRVALVTGASKGIGKNIARRLADEGVHLVLLARGKELLDAAAAEICKATGVRVLAVPTDMREHGAGEGRGRRGPRRVRHRPHPGEQRRRADQAPGAADHLARRRLGRRHQHQDASACCA